MIKLNGVSKSFGGQVVLANVNLTIGDGKKIGLIGNNGCGKSTLFKIICGEIEPDSGTIEVEKENIGYLSQSLQFNETETVKQFIFRNCTVVEEYEQREILKQVEFDNNRLDVLVENLSGGEKTKLGLALLLLQKNEPTTLLLDEPTNNLDAQTLVWLEKFINDYIGAVLLTSHDRYFLDKTIQEIVLLKDGAVKKYGGNYSFYRQQKQIEDEAYRRKYEVQQDKIGKIESNIQQIKSRALHGEQIFGSDSPYQRHKIAKGMKQAIVREKRLEKLLASEEKLNKPTINRKDQINVSGFVPVGKTVLMVQKVTKNFGKICVLSEVNMVLTGQERVWLTGNNGSGKTTLIKIIAANIKADSGQVTLGNGINVGYYNQEQQILNTENTVLDELKSVGFDRTESYRIVAKLLLKTEDLSKTIDQLSYGERAKVAFTKLANGNFQLLLLDEPTNHLDIETREIIEESMANHSGSIIVVSHDQFFIKTINPTKQLDLIEGRLIESNLLE